jgi:hypothetical protein
MASRIQQGSFLLISLLMPGLLENLIGERGRFCLSWRFGRLGPAFLFGLLGCLSVEPLDSVLSLLSLVALDHISFKHLVFKNAYDTLGRDKDSV